MYIKTAVKTAALIIFISIFSACGELSTPLFSSGGTYQIKAMVNGSSLESCSIIRKDDKIIPYFAISVVNDPDLTGLLVYLQNSKGDIIGDKVLYTIDPEEEATEPQEETESEESEINTEDSEEENDETAGQEETELPVQVMEKRTFIDSKPAAKNYDIVIPLKSFTQEMPPFPLPKSMEIGPYSLVFEAVGRYNTLSVSELDIFYLGSVEFRLNDISMYLPWLSDTRLIPVGATVMLEAGLDFDSRLNPYLIWYNGRNIISEGSISQGAGNILWKAPEQSGFYSLRLEVLPYNLNKRTITGISREITLPVSIKASQTGYYFENETDYSAKRPLAAGTVYAEQVKIVTAQIAALAAARTAILAATRTDASATARLANPAVTENSDKAAAAPVMPEHPELLRWYRFDGSLDEASLKPEWMFEEANEKTPRWAAVGQSYGLSTGPDDVYLLRRPISFFRQGQDQGGGIFLFYIKPITEGTIFSAFFPSLATSSSGVWMDMVMREKGITLRLKTRGTTVEIPVKPDYYGEQGFIPIVVEFYIRPYRFEAKLSLGEALSMRSVTGEIRLPDALTGEAKIRLGADNTAPGSAIETKNASVSLNGAENSGQITPVEPEPLPEDFIAEDIPIETEQQENAENENKTASAAVVAKAVTVTALTTIWDEFAVLYSSTPILPEEILIEETEDEQEGETPIKTPDAAEVRKESGATVAEKPKPNSAAGTVNPADAGIENEAPSADNKTEGALIEQIPAAETRQDSDLKSAGGSLQEPVETEDEEFPSLVTLS